MKKFFASALVLALAIGSAQAQKDSTHKHGGKHHSMKEHNTPMQKLKLTPEQEVKMKALRAEFKKEADALKNDKSLTPEQMKARREAMHASHKAQMDAILTPEQKVQMEGMKKDWKDKEGKKDGKYKMKEGKEKGRDGQDMKAMQEELNLTADQKERMAKIRADFKTKHEALRNDSTLTREQKKEKMQELVRAQQEQMKTVLTQEQLNKAKSMKKERPARTKK